MPISTPIARTKTSALARVLDLAPKGYRSFTQGQVKVSRVPALIRKFHDLYGIGCTPGQRLVRKAAGRASCMLVLFWPDNVEYAQWLLLATSGSGLESEHLDAIEDKARLQWLGYELVRRPNNKGRASWTWRRSKTEMREHYAMISDLSNRRYHVALADLLQRIANQPGFHGVREQGHALFREAIRRGFPSEALPTLYWLTKATHGERYMIC